MAIAIVGSGPAGFYCADLLSKALPRQAIHVFERLPLPFGLVRYGVAPDHPGTKAVTRLFERVMQRPQLRFFGKVALGRDLDLRDLEQAYTVVIVATGAGIGRKISCPGAERAPGICGIDLSGLFNGKPGPGLASLPPHADSICIVGNGNVSLDAARLLAKADAELLACGVPSALLDWRAGLGLREIHICGRGGLGATRFTGTELEELGQLADFQPVVDERDVCDEPASNPDAAAILRRWAGPEEAARRLIRFHFGQEIRAWRDGVLHTCGRDGTAREIPAQMIVHAIGQRGEAIPGLPFDPETGRIPNVDGLVRGKRRTYVAGWAANVAGGQIALSRQSAQALLPAILAHFPEQAASEAAPAVDALLRNLPAGTVSWDEVSAAMA